MSYSVPHIAGEPEVEASGGERLWPRWEVFVRQRGSLSPIYSESVHASDVETALQNARDTYFRRGEGVSIWVVLSEDVSVWEPEADDAAAQDPRPDDGSGSTVLWEVFVRHRRGLNHLHAGSIPATDAGAALAKARNAFVAREEGVSVWVVPASAVHAADPEEADSMFEPFADKDYRQAVHYEIPEEVGYM
jgi:ring-1,2-phenylacetyl-CoA epoxidase subunit PaaB